MDGPWVINVGQNNSLWMAEVVVSDRSENEWPRIGLQSSRDGATERVKNVWRSEINLPLTDQDFTITDVGGVE